MPTKENDLTFVEISFSCNNKIKEKAQIIFLLAVKSMQSTEHHSAKNEHCLTRIDSTIAI